MSGYARGIEPSEFAQKLAQKGVAFIDATALGVVLPESALRMLQQVWDRLPPDPHLPASPTTRRRRHARFRFERATAALFRLLDGTYFQSKEHNRVFGGTERRFDPIEAIDLLNNPVIETLIAKCASSLPLPHERLFINCHLMRIIGLPGQPGEPSPEGIHRDGFDYVSLHMVNRVNVHGGQSIVLAKDMMIVAAPMLESPLDTLVMDDRRYLHAGLPFFVREGVGYRDMILCSYEGHLDGPSIE